MLLDTNEISEMMADAFGDIFGTGFIVRKLMVDDGKGGYLVADESLPSSTNGDVTSFPSLMLDFINNQSFVGSNTQLTMRKIPIRVQIDEMSEEMRNSPGYGTIARDYTNRDVMLIILRDGVPLEELGTDDEIITADGRRWKIYEVRTDPARSHWIGRGVQQVVRDSA